ncbi:uncharacterized protein LOC116168877 [Photinus pyralis]|nr:uncharacterized protein LOC116168877 [Photinus pyralis]
MRADIIGAILIFCVVQVFSVKEDSAALNKKCADKFNVEEDFLQKHFDKTHHLPRGNKKYNEMSKCLSDEVGFIQEDGTYRNDLMKQHIIENIIPAVKKDIENREEVVKQAIETCKEPKEGDDRFVDFHNCLVDIIREKAQ